MNNFDKIITFWFTWLLDSKHSSISIRLLPGIIFTLFMILNIIQLITFKIPLFPIFAVINIFLTISYGIMYFYGIFKLKLHEN